MSDSSYIKPAAAPSGLEINQHLPQVSLWHRNLHLACSDVRPAVGIGTSIVLTTGLTIVLTTGLTTGLTAGPTAGPTAVLTTGLTT